MNKHEYQMQRIDAEIAYQLQRAKLQSDYWDELGRPQLLPPEPHTPWQVPDKKPKSIKSDRIGFDPKPVHWWSAFAAIMTVAGILLALIFTNLSGFMVFLHWLYSNDLAATSLYVGLIILGILIFVYLFTWRTQDD